MNRFTLPNLTIILTCLIGMILFIQDTEFPDHSHRHKR